MYPYTKFLLYLLKKTKLKRTQCSSLQMLSVFSFQSWPLWRHFQSFLQFFSPFFTTSLKVWILWGSTLFLFLIQPNIHVTNHSSLVISNSVSLLLISFMARSSSPSSSYWSSRNLNKSSTSSLILLMRDLPYFTSSSSNAFLMVWSVFCPGQEEHVQPHNKEDLWYPCSISSFPPDHLTSETLVCLHSALTTSLTAWQRFQESSF